MHQPATSRLAAWAAAALLALGAAGCSSSDDDDADPPSTLTDPPTTTTTLPRTTSTTTTAVQSTTLPPTTPPPDPPTTLAPTTTSLDDLKAQIAAEVVAGYERMSAKLGSPSLDGLDEWLATVAYPGSEFERLLRERIEYLVSVGDVTIPDDPPINSMSVESVVLDQGDPSAGATLTVCQADNLKTVTPAANSPVGEEIISQESQLAASRYTIHATRSGPAWLRDDYSTVYLGYFPGETACAAP